MTDAAEPALSRQQMEEFFNTCIEKMTSDVTRNILKDPCAGKPSVKLLEIQKQVFDDLGVSQDAGRLAISKIKETYSSDDQGPLLELRSKFAKTVDSTYLQCLEDRRPNTLKKKGKMTRNTVLAFLDACNVKIDTPEIKEKLRVHVKSTGTMPDDIVNEMNNEVMELLGFDREYGQKCFSEFGNSKEFMQDREVAMSFARWRGKTSNTCLALLNEHRKNGGDINADDDVKNKLLELQAKEELDNMSSQERTKLIEKNVDKVNIFHKLPVEGRQRYLDRLSEEEKLELAKSQILISTVLQSQQQLQSQKE